MIRPERHDGSPARFHRAAGKAWIVTWLHPAMIGALALVAVTSVAAVPGLDVVRWGATNDEFTSPKPEPWIVLSQDPDLAQHVSDVPPAGRLQRAATLRAARVGAARGSARELPWARRGGEAPAAPESGPTTRWDVRIAPPPAPPPTGGGIRGPPGAEPQGTDH